MSQFLDTLHSGRVLLMDGAMGTELLRSGIPQGECYELSNLTRPDVVQSIYQAYVNAGAECLLTNTFQANPASLAHRGLQGDMERINRAAVDLARSIGGPERFVLADIGPLEKEFSIESASLLVNSMEKADALLLETFSDPRELGVMVQAQKTEVSNPLPLLISLSYRHSPGRGLRTFLEYSPESCAQQAQLFGVAALGVNCGREITMDQVIEVVQRYRQVTDLPLFARPNAGTPSLVGGALIYPQSPEQMAGRLPELLEAGVAMIGGCCGTTPQHIAAFRPVIEGWNRNQNKTSGKKPSPRSSI